MAPRKPTTPKKSTGQQKGKKDENEKQEQKTKGFVSKEIQNKIISIRAMQKLEMGLTKSVLGLSPSGDMKDLVRRLKRSKGATY
jgi:hypothetical protein